MIILKVGHTKLTVKDLASAEALLKILGDSVSIESRYFADRGHVYYKEHDTEISISINNGEITSDEDYAKLLVEVSK